MSFDASGYISTDFQARFRKQAVRVWSVTLLIVLVWVGAIIVAPFFGPSGVSTSIYVFFSYVCHQIPDRSIFLAGAPMAVCSRCFGIYFGLLLGVVVYPLWRPIDESEPLPRFWLIASLIPVAIDWSLTAFGVWENTHISRFVTGLILGFACATFIVPAVVDIARNLSGRSLRE